MSTCVKPTRHVRIRIKGWICSLSNVSSSVLPGIWTPRHRPVRHVPTRIARYATNSPGGLNAAGSARMVTTLTYKHILANQSARHSPKRLSLRIPTARGRALWSGTVGHFFPPSLINMGTILIRIRHHILSWAHWSTPSRTWTHQPKRSLTLCLRKILTLLSITDVAPLWKCTTVSCR